MWVDLQIKHLCAMKIDYEVEKELGKLPGDLATTYDQIYKRIQNDIHSVPWALKALMWILGAEKPLSPDEWAGGVSWALLRSDGNPSGLGVSVLLDVCQNLVVHDGQQNVMRFAHLSVREFLETKSLDQQAAEMAASACLAILQHPHTLSTQPTRSTDFTPFHRYSIHYWLEHVQRCDENDPTPQLSSALSAFMGSFNHPADAYIHWLEAAKTISDQYSVLRNVIRRLRSTPPNALFAAAYFGFKNVCGHLWEPNAFDPNCTNDAQETPLYLASSRGHTATVRLLLQNGADINHPTHRETTYRDTAPLTAAIRLHNSKLLDLLLDAGAIFTGTEYHSIVLTGAFCGNGVVMQQLLQRDASIEITEDIVIAAAENRDSGEEVMQVLLQKDPSIEITEAIVIEAAGNGDSGKEVMQQLLQKDPSIEITEAIVIEAAGNRSKGKEVMQMLLQKDPSIRITEAIVIAAAGNRDSAKEVMQLLLQKDPSIEITEAIIIAAASNMSRGKKMVQMLLQRDKITEAIVTAAARNGDNGKEVMQQLLQKDPSIEITEAIVIAAAVNEDSGKEVMQQLLQKDPSIEITEAIVIAAAGNIHSGREVMQQLLRKDPSIEITEAIVIAAAGNLYSGKEVMQQLLQIDPSIEITEAIVIAVAGNRLRGEEVMQLLLQKDPSIEITEAIVIAAAVNEDSGKEVMQVLLQKDPSIKITEAIVIAAVRGVFSGEMMQQLLQKDPSIEITEAIVIAAAGNMFGGEEVMQQLLQKDPSIEITEAIVIAAAGNFDSGKEVMQQLLRKDPSIEITEAIVIAAAGNRYSRKEVMQQLLQKDPSIGITEAIVIAAAGNLHSGKEVMQQLLQKDSSIEITEAIVIAAAGNWGSGNEVMQQLLQKDPSIEITEAIIIAAASNMSRGKKMVQMLLQRDKITEAIVTAAARNGDNGKEVMQQLLQKDPSIEITEAIITAAAGNRSRGKEVMQMLLQRDPSIRITEAIVTAAAGNSICGKKVMELLLQTSRPFVTKSSLIAAAFFARHDWFESLCSKIVAYSCFAQNGMQCVIAAIEGGDSLILNACLVSSHESNYTDDHGWTLHMVAIQSRNQMAIEKLQDASEDLMQPISITHWEINPIISPFVSMGGNGTSLAYSGNLPRFPAEFQGLTIAGGLLGSGLSVKGNHPFPPGNMGKNYFEVEILDSVESRCVIDLPRCAPTNPSAATYALDSAANASCIKTCQGHIAARRPITVMDLFEGTIIGTLTRRDMEINTTSRTS
jgi:predicted transcriptional regulator